MNSALVPVTLEQLLESRDNRWATERRLLHDNPGRVLIVLTVVMPGKIKRDNRSLIVARAAVEAIEHNFNVQNSNHKPQTSNVERVAIRDLVTGFEAYWLVGGDVLAVKRQTCAIEESHPLGRLFDIDVIGANAIPVSRQEVGLPPRRCLVCGNEARFCMRNHTHTQEEIQNKINEIVSLV